jgi:hypothetical protein
MAGDQHDDAEQRAESLVDSMTKDKLDWALNHVNKARKLAGLPPMTVDELREEMRRRLVERG